MKNRFERGLLLTLAVWIALCLAMPARAQFSNAQSIQGRPVSPAAPSNTNVIKWNASTGVWEPGAAGSGATIAVTALPIKGDGAGNGVAAAAADIVGLFSSCTGTKYLGADGACYAASTASAYPTVTDASPIAWNLGSAVVTNGIVTLANTTGTRALNLTNLVSGGFYTLVVKQDGTGGAALTLGSGCTWKVSGGGAGAIAVTSAANSIDILTFTYDGTNCYATLQNNFN